MEMSELANIINTERVSEAAPGKGKHSTSAPKYVISGPTPAPPLAAEVIQAAPPPALTREELAAIYKAALTKGASMPQLQVASKPISHFHHPPPPPPLDGKLTIKNNNLAFEISYDLEYNQDRIQLK